MNEGDTCSTKPEDQPIRLPAAVTISVERMMRFCHLMDITEQLKRADTEPECPPLHCTPFYTLLTLTLSFMYSLFDQRSDSINLRRVWTDFHHPFYDALEKFEQDFEPFRDSLYKVRCRYDFHGSLDLEREKEGFDIYHPDRAGDLFVLALRCRDLCQEMTEWFKTETIQRDP